MQYCFQETFARLFYNASSSFFLLFFFFYFTSIFLTRAFNFLGGNLFFPRNQTEYEFGTFSDEEEEEEEEDSGKVFEEENSFQDDHDLEANILDGGQSLFFVPAEISHDDQQSDESVATSGEEEEEDDDDEGEEEEEEEEEDDEREEEEEEVEAEDCDSDNLSVYRTPALESLEGQVEGEEEILIEIPARRDTHDIERNKFDPTSTRTTSTTMNKHRKSVQIMDNNIPHDQEAKCAKRDGNQLNRHDPNYLVFAPSKIESKKLMNINHPQPQGKDHILNNDQEDVFGDTCTIGSTSKDSSEWRSSHINYRDSGTDDPFSSSSRRSCPKWESYAVFQKYDEEMMFLDRISAQKLHETESLRSIQACPRSISERIIHKLGTKHKSSSEYRRNPYHELEATYVAQICLTWEALNWNYKYFQRLRASRSEKDPGCPAYVAQQFQQFLVLLQRYVENEPYEHGRRPEIYARMRRLAPKLLQVPEYRDSEEEIKEETSFGSRISSDSFMLIMEEAMRTFMHFLKADRESRCRILFAAFFKRKSSLPDSALLFLLKKVNQKKKMKLKELRQSGNCLRRRRLKLNEEMEILMALIDLKIVSRVLRMRELAEEQLQWCEAKMSKVRVSDRKLQRDSTPLFFPAH